MPFLGLGLGLPRGGAVQSFSPAALFAAAETGVWYDPSDLTTLFQDAAGTTPVTAVEQPVGLMLDKSRGLVLGSELVTNGDFSGGSTGWTIVGTSTISGGFANIVTADGTYTAISQVFTVVAGRSYKVEFDLVSLSSGVPAVDFYGTNNTPVSTSLGRKSLILVAASTSGSLLIKRSSGVTNFTIDNISVRELPGSHASQSTAASRPVLSARKNLLVNTATLSTQNVTVRAVEHVLSFWGTGTVTLSGVSTAGPLVGTGADNRVYVAFTPTAGTLTLTVSGTVSRAQLEETREGA